ncbi:MAG: DUF192 domain-containing protein [Treponema sp.]|nr:DUF192 domain-containing protein [Treponema sp.]
MNSNKLISKLITRRHGDTESYALFNIKPKPSVSSVLSVPLCEILLILILFIACNSQKLAVQELSIERDGKVITTIKAEIATTSEEQMKGLMHRQNLPDGEGMLFVYERDQVLSFWMKNTYIPLTIAFIASDGRIIEMKDMYPHDTNNIVSSRSVRYALEVPQGWFSRAGVLEGDIVIIEK